MPITMEDLTVGLDSTDRDSLLDDWRWLIGLDKQPILVTAMGNAFVQDPGSGVVELLDAGTGKLKQVAASFDEFKALLSDKSFVYENLLVDDVVHLRESGKLLEPGQVYGFEIPPALGGSFDAENVVPSDVSVHFSVSGQIHRKVKDLPEGTPMSQIRLD